MEALGYERDRLEVILMQFVRLYQGERLLKMISVPAPMSL